MITFMEAQELNVDVIRMMSDDRVPYLYSVIVGSTFICGEGKDADILFLLLPETTNTTIDYFVEKGYEVGGNVEYNGEFVSLKKDNINVLISESSEFVDKWETAAHACRYVLGLLPEGAMTREVRVNLHQIIADGRRVNPPL